ncbi:MAG: hypothetical protein KA521_09035 [Crocinitomicaceae bacterium]|nr:hypothetical protein [Crocinitomicaceae bacterium]
MKNRILFLSLILFVSSNCSYYAQGLVQISEASILYRGFENKVSLGSLNGDSTLMLSSNNATIRKSLKGWIVLPNASKTVELYAINKKQDTIARSTFIVRSLPLPQLYWGKTKENERLGDYKTAKLLSCKYDYPVNMILEEFKIVNWEMNIEGCSQSFKGSGNQLSKEALDIIQFAPKGTMVTIKYDTAYPNSEFTKKRTSIFNI